MTATAPPSDRLAAPAWVATADRLLADVAGWCRELNWPARRVTSSQQDESGEYDVPALLLQVELTQLLLDPQGPSNGGIVVDFYHLPRWDDLAFLIWADGRWQYYNGRRFGNDGDLSRPSPHTFDRPLFEAEVRRMVADAQNRPG